MKTKFKDTEIGLIPEDWDVYSLSELYEFGSGLSKSKNDFGFGYPFLSYKDIFDNFFVPEHLGSLANTTKKERMNCSVKRGDVFLTRTSETADEIGVSCVALRDYPNATFNGFTKRLRPKNKGKIYPEFEGYYFRDKRFRNHVISMCTLTTRASLNNEILGKLKITLPPFKIQVQIASILKPLDDKIGILQRQNKTLEAIGQALFKHWFVDFEFPDEEGKPYKSSGGEMVFNEELGKEIPKGWDAGEFSELVDYKKDSLKAGESLKDRKYVPIDTLPMKKMGLESYNDYTEAQSSLIAFEKDDILFGAMRPYFHRVNISPFSGVTRTTCFVLRPKKPKYLSYSILLLFQDSSIDYANAHSTGSTIPYAVWNNSLEVMPVLKPKDGIIKKFDDLFYPTLSKIRDSILEMQTLSQIRDSLLPKLMSGKIRVPVEVE
jgi:type I restriction enzyme S subunit